MSVLLEHDDIIKSRRALIISSVIVIALHYVKLNSNEIEIFKLQVAVSKDTLVIAAKLSTVYLLYIFLWQGFKQGTEQNATGIEAQLESLTEENAVAEFKAEYDKDMRNEANLVRDVDEYDQYLANVVDGVSRRRSKLEKELRFSRWSGFVAEVFVNIFPALVLAILALTGWHTIFTS